MGHPPHIISLFLVGLAIFWRANAYHVEFHSERSDIDFQGYDFSLIFLESLVCSFCYLWVNADGVRFSLHFMIFKLDVNRLGNNVQVAAKGHPNMQL